MGPPGPCLLARPRPRDHGRHRMEDVVQETIRSRRGRSSAPRLLWLTILLPLLLQAQHVDAQDVLVQPAGSEVPALGRGWDRTSGQVRGQCLDTNVAQVTYLPVLSGVRCDLSHSADVDSFSEAWGFRASGTYRPSIASTVSASAALARQSRRTSGTIAFAYTCEVRAETGVLGVAGPTALTSPAARLVRSGVASPAFVDSCGDSYISNEVRGARLAIVAQVSFATRTESQEFEASLSGSTSLASIQTALNSRRMSFQSGVRVSFSAWQLGGTASGLVAAMGSPSVSGTGIAAISCDADHLADCSAAVAGLLRYASNEFPASIARSPSAPPGSATANLSIVGFAAAPWQNAFIRMPAPVATAALDTLRRELGDALVDALAVHDATDNALNGTMIILPSARSRLEQVVSDANARIDLIIEAGASCWPDATITSSSTYREVLSACRQRMALVRRQRSSLQDARDRQFYWCGDSGGSRRSCLEPQLSGEQCGVGCDVCVREGEQNVCLMCTASVADLLSGSSGSHTLSCPAMPAGATVALVDGLITWGGSRAPEPASRPGYNAWTELVGTLRRGDRSATEHWGRRCSGIAGDRGCVAGRVGVDEWVALDAVSSHHGLFRGVAFDSPGTTNFEVGFGGACQYWPAVPGQCDLAPESRVTVYSVTGFERWGMSRPYDVGRYATSSP